MAASMRYFLVFAALLAAGLPVHASLVAFSESGLWGGDLFLIQNGDPFSISMSWDDTSATNICPSDPANRFCRPLLTFSYTMPPSTGLTVASIPDSKILFAAALYASAGGVFEGVQVNEKSPIDNNFYIFFGGPGKASES